MNLNNTVIRNRLSIDALSALIFIKVNGPKPADFDAAVYASEWIKAGKHGANDEPTGKTGKSENQKPRAFSVLF